MENTSQSDLIGIARRAMLDRGFVVDFPPEVLEEIDKAQEPDFTKSSARDLTHLLWTSIDNDDSRDLDQIEYSESIPNGTRVYVGIADVNSHVPQGSAVDLFAQDNTTSVYTGIQIFPMLPERFSTDLTSLNESKKRFAVVVQMDIDNQGNVTDSTVYQAIVENKSQLTYKGVSIWLDKTPPPYSEITERVLEKINSSAEIQKQILQQDALAVALHEKRIRDGALDFKTAELRPTLHPDGHVELANQESTRASHIIEELMIASNQSVEVFLEAKKFPCLQRVVRVPKNWPRMVELAALHGGNLPPEPHGPSLQNFLAHQQSIDPESFPDISPAMIKLLGRGEYVVKSPGAGGIGHFGLAASNYAHTTAPNRRYPDLITQRLLAAAFNNKKIPYPRRELEDLANHCTMKEDDANRVERQVKKSIAAVALQDRIGESFYGIITGASDKGVFVRLTDPPVEGKVDGNTRGLEVGDHLKVKLTRTDPFRGFIDFRVIGR